MGVFTDGLVGTPEQIAERLTAAGLAGMGYAICYFVDAAYDRRSIDLFASKVVTGLAS